jgi:Mrp family chromosome partitioning ATPase
MGKVLDSLKRRTATTPPADPPAETRETPPPPAALGDEGNETAIPFIEIPEEPDEESAPAAAPAHAPAPHLAFETARPAAPPAPANVAPELIVWHRPDDPRANDYRQACADLLPRLAEQRVTAFLLAPLSSAVDAAVPALNLALALAEGGQRAVLLVDADTQAGRAAALLGRAGAPGVMELLAGVPLPQVVQETGWYRLHLIAAGNRLAEAGLARHGERLRELLVELKTRYDLIVLLAPAWPEAPAAAVLAAACDGVCVLLPRDQANRPPAASLDALLRPGARLLGSLVIATL